MFKKLIKKSYILLVFVFIFASFFSCQNEKLTGNEVSISISCVTILDNLDKANPAIISAGLVPSDGVILKAQNERITAKETALSLLLRVAKNNKIHVDEIGGYVRGIANIYEKNVGAQSGWLVIVNNEQISVGAGMRRIKKDDVVEWHYTCVNGDIERLLDEKK